MPKSQPRIKTAVAGDTKQRNSDCAWDEFDSVSYQKHNYDVLRADDRTILERTRDFFASVGGADDRSGMDVGTGSNLYPVMAMLPWCKKITMTEHSAGNVAWLHHEILDYSPSWDQYWNVLCDAPAYADVANPRKVLADRADVRKGSVFELPRHTWDMGTMFFVAESISSRWVEFETALGCFLDALRPGAPFAAAFMEGSRGYRVGEHDFPAVAIEVPDLKKALEIRTADLLVERIGMVDTALRVGYTGMIFACGFTKSV
jgi:hypothetical protein